MTAIIDRLDRATRERLAELWEIDRLVREPARQRPPNPPLPPVGQRRRRSPDYRMIAFIALCKGRIP